jgi:hypothetical protein
VSVIIGIVMFLFGIVFGPVFYIMSDENIETNTSYSLDSVKGRKDETDK